MKALNFVIYWLFVIVVATFMFTYYFLNVCVAVVCNKIARLIRLWKDGEDFGR